MRSRPAQTAAAGMARAPADPDKALAATYPDDSAPQPADAEEDTAGAQGESMHDDELEDEKEEDQQEIYGEFDAAL